MSNRAHTSMLFINQYNDFCSISQVKLVTSLCLQRTIPRASKTISCPLPSPDLIREGSYK